MKNKYDRQDPTTTRVRLHKKCGRVNPPVTLNSEATAQNENKLLQSVEICVT